MLSIMAQAQRKTSKKRLKAERKGIGFHLHSKTPSEASHRGVQVLFMGLLLLGMGQSLFFAVLPPIARELGLSESQTAIIFSLSAIAWVFCSPFWGRQSDVWGRRNIMVVGLSGFAISTLLITAVIYASQSALLSAALVLPFLIIARSFFGIFGSGTMPAAQAYMADRTTRAKRARGASLITASFGIGNIIGPGLAAGLIVFGSLAPFLIVGTLGLVAAAMVFFLVPQKSRVNFNKGKNKQMSIFAKPLRIFVLLGSLAGYAQSVLIQLTAFYFIDKLGLGKTEVTQLVGIGFTFMAMGALFAQFGIIQRFDPPVRSLLVYSSLILMLAYLGLAFSDSYPVLVLYLGLSGLGFGLMRPGLMAAASLSVSRSHQGAAAGVVNATAAVGHVINPFTGAVLYAYYPQGPFLIVAASMIVFFTLVLWHPTIRKLGSKGFASEDGRIPAPHVAGVPLEGIEQTLPTEPEKTKARKKPQVAAKPKKKIDAQAKRRYVKRKVKDKK